MQVLGNSVARIYSAIHHPDYERIIQDLLKNVTSTDGLAEMLTLAAAEPDSAPSFLSVNKRQEARTTRSSDIITVDVKSDHISKVIFPLVYEMDYDDVSNYLRLLHVTPESSSFAGWLFAARCIHQITRNLPTDALDDIPSLVPMQRIPTRNAVKYRYTPPDRSPKWRNLPYILSDTYEATVDTSTTGNEPTDIDAPDAESELIRLPIVDKKIETYVTIDDINVALRRCYVSAVPNSPLFDAFIIDRTKATGIVIYILQMETGRRPSKVGYNIIKQIRRKIKEQWNETIAVRYVLVVPSSPARVCEWHLPEGWTDPEVKGDVYCLPLPVSSFCWSHHPVLTLSIL